MNEKTEINRQSKDATIINNSSNNNINTNVITSETTQKELQENIPSAETIIDGNTETIIEPSAETIIGSNTTTIIEAKTANVIDNINDPKVSNNSLIEQLQVATQIAEFVANSSIYSKAFETNVLDKEGNIISKVINKNDIIGCILLGNAIGLNPMVSIVMGRQLNIYSYQCVVKGKALGLDAVSSLQNIKPIATKNGLTFHTGVHVIEKVLLDNGVKFEILEDFVQYYWYCLPNGIRLTDKEVEELDDSYEMTTSMDSAVHLAIAKNSKKPYIKRVDFRTTIKFDRPNKNTHLTMSYTLQEAIDAGLRKGYHSSDKDANGQFMYIEGRDNWNKMPRIMLRSRCISLGGNIIVADKLLSTLTDDEAMEIE